MHNHFTLLWNLSPYSDISNVMHYPSEFLSLSGKYYIQLGCCPKSENRANFKLNILISIDMTGWWLGVGGWTSTRRLGPRGGGKLLTIDSFHRCGRPIIIYLAPFIIFDLYQWLAFCFQVFYSNSFCRWHKSFLYWTQSSWYCLPDKSGNQNNLFMGKGKQIISEHW